MDLTVIEEVLQQGCGVSVQQVVTSEEMEVLEKKQERLLNGEAEHDELQAYKAGHQGFGQLINEMSEEEAVRKAASSEPAQFGHGQSLRSLIEMTGRELVRAASRMLSPEIIEMGERWKLSAADEQIAITRELCLHLLSENQIPDKGPLCLENVHQSISAVWSQFFRNAKEGVLPNVYGSWGKERSSANCQGKSQMLIAFAQMVGTSAYIVMPEKTAKDYMDDLGYQVVDMLRTDMSERDILYGDDMLFEGMVASDIVHNHSKNAHAFHMCVVMQVADGRWVVIDSHAMCWGIVPTEWDLDGRIKMLEKYKTALPGLSIACRTRPHSELEARVKSWAARLIQISKEIEQRYNDAPHDFMGLIEALIARRVPDMMQAMIEWKEQKGFCTPDELIQMIEAEELLHLGKGVDLLEAGHALQYMTAMMMVLGKDEDEGQVGEDGQGWGEVMMRTMSMSKMFEWMQNEEWRAKRMGALLTSLHWLAVELVKDWLVFCGELLHGNVLLFHPHYSIAMAAINSIARYGRGKKQEFFLDYQYNPVGLVNAVRQVRNGTLACEDEMVQFAVRALREMPWCHPMIEQFREGSA